MNDIKPTEWDRLTLRQQLVFLLVKERGLDYVKRAQSVVTEIFDMSPNTRGEK